MAGTKAVLKQTGVSKHEDLTPVFLDLETGVEVEARANKKYGRAIVFRLRNPILPKNIAYPHILAGGSVELTTEQLIEEIELVLEMCDEQSAPMLYSLLVTSPGGWRWPETGPSTVAIEPNPGRRAELETGYVYHEVLYRLSSAERSELLRQVLNHAGSVEVAVRQLGESESVRTDVTITSTPG